MKENRPKLKREELIAMLQTQGWDMVTGSEALPTKNRSLKELVKIAHERHVRGESPGLISQMEKALELDLIQLQELWEYLGLPM